MNFSAKVKSQIISEKISSPCCQLAALSAYLRTAGSIEISGGKIGFSLEGERDNNLFFSNIIKQLYGVTPSITTEKQQSRTKLTLINDVSFQILKDAQMVKIERSGYDIQLGISEKLVKKPCCQHAFIKGAFLGSGSVTVPKMKSDKATGYHLEFVFSKYLTALDFSHILSDNGYIAKLVERKDAFVVYYKNSEEIGDLLVLMGAKNACLDLQDIILKKTVRNNINRITNCEMSNLNKQIDASLKSRIDIKTIDDCLGLDNLPLSLQLVAKARLEYPEDTLSALADRLQITKSCLSHRLKKLSAIAEGL